MLRRALTRNAADTSASLTLYELLRLQGRDEAAADVLEKPGAPPRLELLLARARMLREMGQQDREKALLAQAVEQFPGSAAGWWLGAGIPPVTTGARAAYEQALSGPARRRTWLWVTQSGDWTKAVAAYHLGRAGLPTPRHVAWPRRWLAKGPGAATEALRTAVAANPGSVASGWR